MRHGADVVIAARNEGEVTAAAQAVTAAHAGHCAIGVVATASSAEDFERPSTSSPNATTSPSRMARRGARAPGSPCALEAGQRIRAGGRVQPQRLNEVTDRGDDPTF